MPRILFCGDPHGDRSPDATAEVASHFAEIRSLIEKMASKIDVLDGSIDQRAAEVKNVLIRWIVSVAVLQVVFVAGLVLKLGH